MSTFTILPSGNIGIGTTSPTHVFHVERNEDLKFEIVHDSGNVFLIVSHLIGLQTTRLRIKIPSTYHGVLLVRDLLLKVADCMESVITMDTMINGVLA